MDIKMKKSNGRKSLALVTALTFAFTPVAPVASAGEPVTSLAGTITPTKPVDQPPSNPSQPPEAAVSKDSTPTPPELSDMDNPLKVDSVPPVPNSNPSPLAEEPDIATARAQLSQERSVALAENEGDPKPAPTEPVSDKEAALKELEKALKKGYEEAKKITDEMNALAEKGRLELEEIWKELDKIQDRIKEGVDKKEYRELWRQHDDLKKRYHEIHKETVEKLDKLSERYQSAREKLITLLKEADGDSKAKNDLVTQYIEARDSWNAAFDAREKYIKMYRKVGNKLDATRAFLRKYGIQIGIG